MGETKKIKAKVIHKHELEKDWLNSSYIPEVGEVVFYDPEVDANGNPDSTKCPEGRAKPITHTRQKNGDGKNSVKDLPFAGIKNLLDGEGENALQQRYIIGITDYSAQAIGDNSVALGGKRYDKSTDEGRTPTSAEGNQSFAVGGSSHAYGDWSIAMGKDSKAYQRSSFAAGGGTKAGLTYEEWLVANSKSDNDESLEEYKQDYSLAAVFGDSNKALGRGSFAAGTLNTSEGKNSFSAGGTANKAIGAGSHVEGNKNTASGIASHAEGHNTNATGESSHSEGFGTKALGMHSHSEGQSTIAEGDLSHAEGNSTKANAEACHSEGKDTIASGKMSHAEGYDTKATGENSHSEGAHTTASGNQSHAEGETAQALGEVSHAEGRETVAEGVCSHARGWNTHAVGKYSSVEGSNTIARGQSSHAEGDESVAGGVGSHAEGKATTANGDSSHAEGRSTQASEIGSHAEGQGTISSGLSSHAEGDHSLASGLASHAEGQNSKASGSYSHAGGLYTIASATAQTAIGKYNRENNDALFIVGNGLSRTDRRNAFVVNANGTLEADTTPTEGNHLTNKKYVDSKITQIENLIVEKTAEYRTPKTINPIRSAQTLKINPNTMYVFKMNANLTCELWGINRAYEDEWLFTIAQGATKYTVTLPTIMWKNGTAPRFEANTTTVCRVRYAVDYHGSYKAYGSYFVIS